MTELCDWTARDLRAAIGARAVSPVELLESCLGRTAAVNGAVNALVTIDRDGARAAAREAEAAVMRGDPLGALHGLPVGIKDSQDTAGLRTTYGSPLFAEHVPAADEACVARLRAAGAIVLGKTNTPEWTAGANTRNPVHGATGNAFDPVRSAAGSSGGSAVALACGMVPLASGSDTGGSLRNPAGYAGIVGLRPSPGLVGSGKRPFGWSNLATDGPMARDVADCALMLSVLAGDDPQDPLSYALPGEAVRGRPALWSPPRPPALNGLRLAFTEDFGFAPTERAVRRAFRRRAAAMAPLFARAEEATPDCAGADDGFAVLRASLFLGSFGDIYREHPDGLGRNVRVNVEEGLGYTLADGARAAAAQTRIARAFADFFGRHDLLVSPTLTLSPRPWSESFPAEIDGAPTRSYYHWLGLAYAVTLAGCPALSLPMGLDEAGLPFGVQIVGPRGGDALLLGAAAALEEAFRGDADFGRPRPDLARLAAAPPIAAMPGFRDWT